MKNLYVIFFIVILSSCAAQSKLSSNAVNVRVGMTDSELMALMGAPGNRQFSGENEAWQYCSSSYPNPNSYVLVWLKQGAVTGMQTYEREYTISTAGCSSGFITVSWDEAP